jgi:hypothetical protein
MGDHYRMGSRIRPQNKQSPKQTFRGESMHIVERRPGGYLIECTCARGGAFFQRSPTLTVECPKCGKTQNTADMVVAWMTIEQPKDAEAAD